MKNCHTKAFKLLVVRRYLSGFSKVCVAAEFGISQTTVKNWVEIYRLHGERGLDKRLIGKKYPLTFKLSAVKMVREEGVSMRQTAWRLGLSSTCPLWKWLDKYDKYGIEGLIPKQKRIEPMATVKNSKEIKENKKLKKENLRFRIENTIRKEYGKFDKLKHNKKTMIAIEVKQKYGWNITTILIALNLPRNCFYYHKNNIKNEVDKYAELKMKIKEIFEKHNKRYGYRRITWALRNEGMCISFKLVRKLMKSLELKAKRSRKYKHRKGSTNAVSPNTLDRNFQANKPLEKLTTDVTEFKVCGIKVYLSSVLDMFNGEIIAYAIAFNHSAKLSLDTVKQLIVRLNGKKGVLFHSDQGWDYRTPAYRALLASANIEQSMSRKANCWDNAVKESFFATVKTEFFYGEHFDCVKDFVKQLHEYIRYYNNDRIKLRLNGKSPIQFRLEYEKISVK